MKLSMKLSMVEIIEVLSLRIANMEKAEDYLMLFSTFIDELMKSDIANGASKGNDDFIVTMSELSFFNLTEFEGIKKESNLLAQYLRYAEVFFPYYGKNELINEMVDFVFGLLCVQYPSTNIPHPCMSLITDYKNYLRGNKTTIFLADVHCVDNEVDIDEDGDEGEEELHY